MSDIFNISAENIRETLLIECSQKKSNEDGAEKHDAGTPSDSIIVDAENVQDKQRYNCTDGNTNQSNNTQTQDSSRDLQEFLHNRTLLVK